MWLEEVPLEDLRGPLDNDESKAETMRLMVAILYKQGPSVPMIAAWFDLREATVYGWFDRLEPEPILEAIKDRPRPGRPPKLTREKREQFESALHEPPREHGVEAPAWPTVLAQQHLREEFGSSIRAGTCDGLCTGPAGPGRLRGRTLPAPIPTSAQRSGTGVKKTN